MDVLQQKFFEMKYDIPSSIVLIELPDELLNPDTPICSVRANETESS